MNQFDRERAIESLDTYIDSTAEDDSRLHRTVDTYRGIAFAGLQDVLEVRRDIETNGRNLVRFAGALRRVDEAFYERDVHGGRLTFSDEQEALQFQKNVIWAPDIFNYDAEYRDFHPAWIIGKRLAGKKHSQLLLLHLAPEAWQPPMEKRAPWFQQITLKTKRLNQLREKQADKVGYSFDELHGMTLSADNRLAINPLSAGSVWTSGHTYGNRKLHFYEFQDRRTFVIYGVGSTGNFADGISSSDMHTFDVYSHLNNLARTFGKVAALREIYQTWE